MDSKGTGDLTLLEPVGNNLVTTSLTSVFWDSLPSPSSHLPLTSWYWESSLWGILTIYRSCQSGRCHLTSAINSWWLQAAPTIYSTRPTYSDSSFCLPRSPSLHPQHLPQLPLRGQVLSAAFPIPHWSLGPTCLAFATATSFKRSNVHHPVSLRLPWEASSVPSLL